MSKRVRIIVACACAVVAMLACLLYSKHVNEEAERERAQTLKRYGGEVASLVVANRTIEAGETITASDVEMRDWISSLAPEEALLSMDEAVGREVSVPIAANAPLCALNFRDLSQIEEIPAGHVAVSVPITDKLGISPAVSAGSRVAAYKATQDSADPIGGIAIVLAAPSANGSSLGRGTITIAVASNDVAAILASSAAGDLRLVVPADDVMELPKKKERTNDVAPQKETDSQGERGTTTDANKTATAEDEKGE